MSSKKDMRRADYAVPYADPPKEDQGADVTSTMTTTMPMIAMFTRNRMIAWAAIMVAVQGWMSETPEQRKKASTPSWMSVAMAASAALTTYLPLFMPPPAARGVASTGTEAPAPVPPS